MQFVITKYVQNHETESIKKNIKNRWTKIPSKVLCTVDEKG